MPGEKSRRYPPVQHVKQHARKRRAAHVDGLEKVQTVLLLGTGQKEVRQHGGVQNSHEKSTRRFSLIPASFSIRAIGIGKDYGQGQESQQDLPIQDPPRLELPPTGHADDLDDSAIDGMFAQLSDPQHAAHAAANASPIQPRFAPSGQFQSPNTQYMQQGAVLVTGSDTSVDKLQQNAPRPAAFQGEYDNRLGGQDGRGRVSSRGHRGVLQKNKRLLDAYDTDEFSRPHDHSGSSGAARRVMDFFRRRAKARGGEDR